jgi:hypothetical protein
MKDLADPIKRQTGLALDCLDQEGRRTLTQVNSGVWNKIKSHFTNPRAVAFWTVAGGMGTVLTLAIAYGVMPFVHAADRDRVKPESNSTSIVTPASSLPLPIGGGQPGSTTPTSTPSAGPPIALDKHGYVLKVSTFVNDNDRDKIDLDTGCPGWGSTAVRVGPRRCGELADIVLDEDGIHTPDERPRLDVLPPGIAGDYQTCRAALDQEPSPAVNQIDSEQLREGVEICTATDLSAMSHVHVDRVTRTSSGTLSTIKISFIVWQRKG